MNTKGRLTSAGNFNLACEQVAMPNCALGEFSFQTMLDNGVLVNVTAWATREMGFPRGKIRLVVSVTAKLWRVLHRIPKALTFFQTMRGRGHDTLWLAAWALMRAQQHFGQNWAAFAVPLPTGEMEEDAKVLRVEYVAAADGGPLVVIGLTDEFPLP